MIKRALLCRCIAAAGDCITCLLLVWAFVATSQGQVLPVRLKSPMQFTSSTTTVPASTTSSTVTTTTTTTEVSTSTTTTTAITIRTTTTTSTSTTEETSTTTTEEPTTTTEEPTTTTTSTTTTTTSTTATTSTTTATTTTTTTTNTTATTSTTSTTTTTTSTITTTTATTTTTSTTLLSLDTLYFPRALQTLDSQTGIAVVNMGASGIQLNFKAYDDSGKLISGAGFSNPAVKLLGPGGQMADLLQEIFGTGFLLPGGWIELSSPGSKLAGFFLEFDPGLNRLLGADAIYKGETRWIIPQIGDIGIDLANLSSDSAGVSLQLRNDQGVSVSRQDLILPGKGHLSRNVESLLPLLGYSGAGRIDISSTKSLAAFATTGRESVTTGRLTGYNALSSQDGAPVLYAPQYVVGGGYQSRFYLVNLEDSAAVKVTLRWLSDSGSLLGYPLTITLPPMGATHLEGSQPFGLSAGERPIEGYLEVRGDLGNIAGVVAFSDTQGQLFAASLHAVTATQSRVLYAQLADDDIYFTGVAILNPGLVTADVRLNAYSRGGQPLGTADLQLPPGARNSTLLSEAIAGLPKVSEGYFTIESSTVVASFAVFGTRDLRVLAAIPPKLY